MNNANPEKLKIGKEPSGLRGFLSKFGGKTRDIIILIVCGLLLLVVGWSIFHSKGSTSAAGNGYIHCKRMEGDADFTRNRRGRRGKRSRE